MKNKNTKKSILSYVILGLFLVGIYFAIEGEI